MPTIKIKRTSEYLNRLRDYKIFIDELQVGTIANGETKEYTTSEGQHTITAKIDWCSSPDITININENSRKNLQVGGFKNGNWIILIGLVLIVIGFILNLYLDTEWSILIALPVVLILLFYLTIGQRKFLTLKEI